MSNLILTTLKQTGQAFLRSGGKNIGKTFVKTALKVGMSYGRKVLFNAMDTRVFEGPRLESLHIQSSRDGAPMARIYGRARIAGQIIWAARVKEHVREKKRGGGKGGPRLRTYSYTLSFAVGLCEGEIAGIERIWANGHLLPVKDINMRLYKGTQDQQADPLISEIEGEQVPAFRGTAYVVFEDMPIDDFGARLPQLSFEVLRLPARSDDSPRLEDLVTGVDLIPATGEYAYGQTIAEERLGPGASRALNMNNLAGVADIELALDQLETHLPKCRNVAVVVSWFGDDLRAGQCRIRPGTETRTRVDLTQVWSVGSQNRHSAYLIHRDANDKPVFGGTPSDASVVEAIQALKSRGFKVSFYPFILMDIAEDNTLPNPYGGTSQPVFPWRGRITCHPAAGQPGSVDQTSAAEGQVAAFFGSCRASDFTIANGQVLWTGAETESYRRMILHYAHLTQMAGGVDSFLIGSELRGLTQIRGAGGTYPSVAQLVDIAAEVRGIVGAGVKLSYAADWSEYFGHHPQDGSGDIRFHLDPLWADDNIDAIGIDAYFPLADWREGRDHLDAQTSASIYEHDYLAGNIEGGEGYDWYYASAQDRQNQIRTPITDGRYQKPWMFRYKDVKSWWANPHYERTGGVQHTTPTGWVPQSKPVWFTEVGCPAIDKGANQPNVFWDPKSSESAAPYFSNATRDDLIQRRYLEAFLSYWQEANDKNPVSTIYHGPMVALSQMHIWCWDARPYPDFPAREAIWSDGENWRTGHWLSGRTGLVSLADITKDICRNVGVATPDTSGLFGMVTGYVLDRPMTARAALEPLAGLYAFDIVEGADGLKFSTPVHKNVHKLAKTDLVFKANQSVLEKHYADSEAHIKDVRLGFVDPSHAYQSASVLALDHFSQIKNALYIEAPLVLDKGQAKSMAELVLQRTRAENRAVVFSLAGKNLALEIGDIVSLEDEDGLWRIDELTQAESLQITAIHTGPFAARFINAGEVEHRPPPPWVPAGEAVVLDIPDIRGAGRRSGPLVGVQMAPFSQSAVRLIKSLAQTPEQILTQPVLIGETMSIVEQAPSGRFATGHKIEIRMPGADLAALPQAELLAGGNVFALETSAGWEILQAGQIELAGPGQYRLQHLLRGQLGTEGAEFADAYPVPAGARIVFLPQGWQNLPIPPDLKGTELTLQITSAGRSQSQTLTHAYQARHLRPLSPVHLRGGMVDDILHLSWIRRTRLGGDGWAQPDVPLAEAQEFYTLDFVVGENIILSRTSEQARYEISRAVLEAAAGGIISELVVTIRQVSQHYGPGAKGVWRQQI